MGVSEVRDKLGKRVEAAHFLEQLTVITHGKNSEPRAVIVPYSWLPELLKRQENRPDDPQPPEGVNA